VKIHEFHIQPSVNPDFFFQIRYRNIRSGSELRNGMDGVEHLPPVVHMGAIIKRFRAVDSLHVRSHYWNHYSRTHDRLLFLRFGKGSGRCVDGMVAKPVASMELSQGSIEQLHDSAGERSALPVCSYPGCYPGTNIIDPWDDHVDHPGFHGHTDQYGDCTGSTGSPGVCHWINDFDRSTLSHFCRGQGYTHCRSFRLGGYAA